MPTPGPFDPEGVSWTPVSPRLAIARRGPMGLACLAIALIPLVIAAVTGLGWVAWLAALPLAAGAWGWWVIGRQVRAWGYAERADDLLVRHGVMRRELVVVPYGRMQYVDVQAGPVDRLVGIARLQLHTA